MNDKKKAIVYIDGYNLYYGRLRGSAHKWLDLVALFREILRIQDPSIHLVSVKLFTAPALAKFSSHGQKSVNAQQAYHRALEELYPELFNITFGKHSHDKSGTKLPVFSPGQAYDRNNRTLVWKLEEKKTDVNLAIAMYRDVAKGLCNHVVICSNDSDAEPVLEAITEDFPTVQIGVVTPIRPPTNHNHRAVSASLAKFANWTRRYIQDDELSAAQLPEQIATRKKPILRPAHW